MNLWSAYDIHDPAAQLRTAMGHVVVASTTRSRDRSVR